MEGREVPDIWISNVHVSPSGLISRRLSLSLPFCRAGWRSWLHIDIDVFRPSFSLFISSPPSVSPIRIIDYRSWLSSPTSCSIQLRLDCLHIIFLHYRTWPFLMLSSHNLSATATVGSYSWYICVWINTDIAHFTFPSEPITKELTEIKISKLHTHPLWSIFLTTVEPIGWIDNRSWLRYGF